MHVNTPTLKTRAVKLRETHTRKKSHSFCHKMKRLLHVTQWDGLQLQSLKTQLRLHVSNTNPTQSCSSNIKACPQWLAPPTCFLQIALFFNCEKEAKIPQTSKRETEKVISPYLNWAPIWIMILHIGTWEESRSCRLQDARRERLPGSALGCSTLVQTNLSSRHVIGPWFMMT